MRSLPATAVPGPALVLAGVLLLAGCAPGGDGRPPADEASDMPAAGTSDAASPASTTRRSPLAPVVPVAPPETGGAGGAVPDPSSLPAPYIASATWSSSPYGRTLMIGPTDSGRRTAGLRDADRAWQEVLRLAPDADSPGMRAQFVCHWDFARTLEPDKPTWNIEPWRPVVDELGMLTAGCNPGGPEV